VAGYAARVAAVVVGVALLAGNASASERGEPSDAETFIRTYYDEVFNRRNTAWIRETTRKDVIGHGPGIDDRVEGIDAVVDFSEYVYAIYDDYRLTVDDVIAAGNRVVVRATVTALHKPTGRRVRFFGQTTYRLDDGRIAEYWRSYDRLDLYERQLGGWRP